MQLSQLGTPAFQTFLLNSGINLVAAIAILAIGWMLGKWAARLARAGLDEVPHFDPTLKPLIASTLRYGIIVIALLAVLGRFGVQTTSLVALLGAAGIAIGLALQGTLSNVASGVMLLLLRPVRVGESAMVGDVSGLVREIGLFRTILVTDDGRYLSVPNTTIFSGSITNNSREPTRKVVFNVTLDMSADIFEARKAVLDVVNTDRHVLKVPARDVTVAALGEFTIVFSVQAWVQSRDFGAVQSDLQFEVRRRFETAPVAAPQRLVGIASFAKTTEQPGKRSH